MAEKSGLTMSKASVIILVWNGREYLEACLGAVLAQDYRYFEVIVVDNGSTDGSPDLVARRFPGVRLIRNERNLGFAAGNNVGLLAAASQPPEASSDLIVLLNQDTVVHPGWLESLALVFADPTIGIAGCKLLYPDGTIQHAGGYLYGPRGETDHIDRHVQDAGMAEPPAAHTEALSDVEFVTGAALAISRAALDKVGPMDEGFWPAYYEDLDWCFRAKAAGFRVVVQPQAIVTHYESTATDALSYDRKQALNQGRIRFVFKYWPDARLMNEFGPAELAWVAAMYRCEELMAARRAYLNTLLALADILAFRACSLEEADALAGLLTDLRAAATPFSSSDSLGMTVAGSASATGRLPANLLDSLREYQTLREQPFTSDVPVLGRLIVGIRTLWSSVATKWYVRPIAHQQSLFNAQLLTYLQDVERRMQGQGEDIAANIRELTLVAEHLARNQEMKDRRDSGD